MNKQDKVFLWFVGIIAFIILIAFLLSIIGIESKCHIKEKFNNDLYCTKSYRTNLTNSFNGWVERSHEADRLYEIKRQERLEEEREEQKKIQECYNAGYLVNESFTIKDYGLNCRKIDYLNDHLMDDFQKKDGGYISVSRNVFFTNTRTEAKMFQYNNERILATGHIIENFNYHVDCEGKKHKEKIDYFTEEEFVMYYVGECIQ